MMLDMYCQFSMYNNVCKLRNKDIYLCDPMEVKSTGGSKSCLVLKDDYSRFRRVFFLKEKREMPGCIEMFLAEATIAGNVVKMFMSDRRI